MEKTKQIEKYHYRDIHLALGDTKCNFNAPLETRRPQQIYLRGKKVDFEWNVSFKEVDGI